ncbi:MAG TPA: hydrogenase maturation nickel metallochaperone HypA [Armatimonadota bacterium]|jgi:hydrogenase nickel incorporation protein HypA/HybF
MHEVSIMESALESAEAHARKQGAARILRMGLRIGDASGVVPDALEFAFGAVTDGTMAEGATLEIERVPIAAWCAACNAEFAPPDILACCPTCGAFSADIRRGREMQLSFLEVE